MSDQEKEIITSEGEEQELSKEERLEAARKKFEELKKKKKKGKKKKKAEGDDKAESEEPEESVEPEEKEDPKVEEPIVVEQKVEEEKLEVQKVEEPKAEEKEKVEEEQKVESEEQKEENVVVAAKIESNDNKISTDSDTSVPALQEIIDQQKNTIKKLRNENTDLKLSKMDLQDKISELEQLVEQLKKSGGVMPPPVHKLVPAEPVFTKNDYASQSTQNLTSSTTEDFREKLMVWKGWQVDMTNWGGVQSQVVRL